MPEVSVVIPAYNSERFVGETLQSVLDQTFQDFELILIDDGSTDKTREVVTGFPDPRLRYFYQENRGVSVAYNRGFNLSKGQYVLFLDSDDVLVKNALEKSVLALDSHPEVGFSYGQAWIMDEDGHVYRLKKSNIQEVSGLVDSKLQIRELLYTHFLITPSTVMVRRECLEEVQAFNEKMKSLAEDNHLYVRLTKRFPAFYIAEPLVKYRFHPAQLHKRVDPRAAEKAFMMVLEEIYGDPQFAPQFQKWKHPAYFYSYHRAALLAYGKDMTMARHYMRKAMKVYPQALLSKNGINLTYKYLASFLPVMLWSTLRDLKWRLKSPPITAKE